MKATLEVAKTQVLTCLLKIFRIIQDHLCSGHLNSQSTNNSLFTSFDYLPENENSKCVICMTKTGADYLLWY